MFIFSLLALNASFSILTSAGESSLLMTNGLFNSLKSFSRCAAFIICLHYLGLTRYLPVSFWRSIRTVRLCFLLVSVVFSFSLLCLRSGFSSFMVFVTSPLAFKWSRTFWTACLSCSSFSSGVLPRSRTPRVQIQFPRTVVFSIFATNIRCPVFSDPTVSEKVSLSANCCKLILISSINFRQSFWNLDRFVFARGDGSSVQPLHKWSASNVSWV